MGQHKYRRFHLVFLVLSVFFVTNNFPVYATSLTQDQVVKSLVNEGKTALTTNGKLSDILVIFRLNGVLLRSRNVPFQLGQMLAHTSSFDRICKQAGSEVINQAFATGFAKEGVEELEPTWRGLINKLRMKTNGMKVMGIETITPGHVGGLGKMSRLINEQLSKLGYPFSDVFKKEFDLSDVNSHGGIHPTFKDGVLYTNDTAYQKSLGECMVSFLQKLKKTTGWEPKMIAYIDTDAVAMSDLMGAIKQTNDQIKLVELPLKPKSGPMSFKSSFILAWETLIDEVRFSLAEETSDLEKNQKK